MNFTGRDWYDGKDISSEEETLRQSISSQKVDRGFDLGNFNEKPNEGSKV